MTSWSPLAHREVRPRKVEAKDHQVEVINKPPPHECLNECSIVSAVTVIMGEFSASCIRHMIQKPHQVVLKH